MNEGLENEEGQIFKELAAEMVKAVAAQQKEPLEALAQRLSELGVKIGNIDISLARIGYMVPLQNTAHLAMQALIRSMRGPHEAREIATTAWTLALEMHAAGEEALRKFGENRGVMPESGNAEATERRDTERPGPLPSTDSHDSPAL